MTGTVTKATRLNRASRPSNGDSRTVRDYERMLREARPEVIEQAHVFAFERLTPSQLDLLYVRFTAREIDKKDRPTEKTARALARSATALGTGEPARLRALLRPLDANEPRANWTHTSILETVATFAVSTVVWAGEKFDLSGDIAGWDDWF